MTASAADGDGVLSRFLFHSNEFKETNARPHAFAAMLDKARTRYEHSVFATAGLDAPSVWAIATQHVEPTRGMTSIARALITIADVQAEGLSVAPDAPPDRHAVIVGWPSGEDDEQKAERKSLAQLLAARASARVRPF